MHQEWAEGSGQAADDRCQPAEGLPQLRETTRALKPGDYVSDILPETNNAASERVDLIVNLFDADCLNYIGHGLLDADSRIRESRLDTEGCGARLRLKRRETFSALGVKLHQSIVEVLEGDITVTHRLEQCFGVSRSS